MTSWLVSMKGWALVTVVSPQPSFEDAKLYDVRPFWFIVEPDREQLIQIGELIDAGQLRSIVETVLPLLD